MSLSDDDDLELSTSDARHFARADKGKTERLKQELQKASLSSMDPKSSLKLSVLKSQIGKEQREKQVSNQAKTQQTFGTKTREDELKGAILTINDKPSSDQAVAQEKVAQAAKDARSEEEVQDSE